MIQQLTLAGPSADLTECIASAYELVTDVIVIGCDDAPPTGCGSAEVHLVPRVESFADLRNLALSQARGPWVLWLDADERAIVRDADAVRDLLRETSLDCMTVNEAAGMFRQPKLMRAGSLTMPRAPWRGRVHEYAEGITKGEMPVGALEFAELPKTAEQVARKIERDTRLLFRQAADDPQSMRWPFYLGETKRLAGEWGAARSCYYECVGRRESDSTWHREQAAWSMFKSSRCAWDSGEWDPLEDLTVGMKHAPWMVELPWFAAFVCYRKNRPTEAAAWARMAEAIRGTGPRRYGFREDEAHGDGPRSILAACE